MSAPCTQNDCLDTLSPLLQRRIEEWSLRSFFINTSAAVRPVEAWFAAYLPHTEVGYFNLGI